MRARSHGSAVDQVIDSYKQNGMVITYVDAECVKSLLGLDRPAVDQFFSWIGGIRSRVTLGDCLLPIDVSVGTSILRPEAARHAGVGHPHPDLHQPDLHSAGPVLRGPSRTAIARRTPSASSAPSLTRHCPVFWVATLVLVYPGRVVGLGAQPVTYVSIFQNSIGEYGRCSCPRLSWVRRPVRPASSMRTVRTMTLEVMRQDYIRTAWAKACRREPCACLTHAFRNSTDPRSSLMIGGAVGRA